MLQLEGVTRSYATEAGPVQALRGVDLDVPEQAYVVIHGPSGAGKTTLLHLAALLDDPEEGRVLFDGREVRRLSGRERAAVRLREIGLVFQHHYLVPDLTVRENVALPALALGSPDAPARADALLARVGLAGVAARLPRELSGGEQQRAGVARALVNRPRLVIADEPTGDLDPENAARVEALLEEAHGEGAALLVVTHDPARFSRGTRRRIEAGRIQP